MRVYVLKETWNIVHTGKSTLVHLHIVRNSEEPVIIFTIQE
jgi:hypothetical protein